MLQGATAAAASQQQFSIKGAEVGNSGIYEAEIKQQLNTMAGLCLPESSSNMFKGVKFRQLPEEWSSRSQAERDAYVEHIYK